VHVRIIGIGQPAAGDDGVGCAVLAALRRRGVPHGVELVPALEPTALIDALDTPAGVILVDALAGGEPGAVRTVAEDELACRPGPVSSHGVGVAAALALARQLHPGAPSWLRIVTIGIRQPDRYTGGLSPAVAAAIPAAVALVLQLVSDGPRTRAWHAGEERPR
jgi:hydrogenase maturation protease